MLKKKYEVCRVVKFTGKEDKKTFRLLWSTNQYVEFLKAAYPDCTIRIREI